MRAVQRLKTLLLMELLLGIAKTLSQNTAATKENLRAETISVSMRLLAATLGSINLKEDFGFRFMFADTMVGANSEYKSAFENLTPLLDRLLGTITESPSTATDSSDRLERAVLLTQLYEQTLDFNIKQSGESGDEITLIEPERGKKRMGQFYTPQSLARRTVSTAFNQLFADRSYNSIEKIKSLKVLDPAMGGGVFILSALEYLVLHCEKKKIKTSKLSLADCLYGVDLDPLACEVAPLALWLYCVPDTNLQPRTIASFGTNFKHADALLSGWADSACVDKRVSDTSSVDTGTGGNIFLWDNEFPQIFRPPSETSKTSPAPGNGFDVIISNPPWELARPNSQEFFTKTCPDFRKLTKQEALVHSQKLLAEHTPVSRRWQKEQQDYQSKAKHIREQIAIQSAARPLFAAQGESDLNIYKLFLDLGFALLKDDGSMAMIVPSGILADKGAFALRRMFLTKGRLHTVETFVNADRTFPIHPSFAYSVIGVQKDGETRNIRVKFDQQSNLQFTYQQKDISILSPRWLTIFDVSHPKDLEILKKLHTNGVPLGGEIPGGIAGGVDEVIDEVNESAVAHSNESVNSNPNRGTSNASGDSNWNLKFKREYDMTNDSHLFRTVSDAEHDGFKCDIFGNWIKGPWREEKQYKDQAAPRPTPLVVPSHSYQFSIKIDEIEEVLLPLYEGRMIGQFDYSQKCHLSGSGRTAIWQPNNEHYAANSRQEQFDLLNLLIEQSKPIRPHYLIQPDAKLASPLERQLKTGYLAVGSATNVRTMLASALFMVPCGNSVPVFGTEKGMVGTLALISCLNSFVFDYALRMRMTGNNVNYFLLQECPLPHIELITSVHEILALAAAINLNHVRYAAQWLELSEMNSKKGTAKSEEKSEGKSEKKSDERYHLFATSKLERLHIRSMLDALIADAFKLTYDEYAWILRGCDRQASPDKKAAAAAHAKGFWRDGKSVQPSMRLPVLALEAYRTLLDEGRESFMKKTSHFEHGKVDEAGREDLKILERNLQAILQQRRS